MRTPQGPEVRASRQDAQKVESFKADWPQMKKGKRRKDARSSWSMRAVLIGFYRLAARVRTRAGRRGERPRLWLPVTRDHLSVVGVPILEGRLLSRTREGSINSKRVVQFLGHILRQVQGKALVVVLVVRDGEPRLTAVERSSGGCFCGDRDELRYEIPLAPARLRHRKGVLAGYIGRSGNIQ